VAQEVDRRSTPSTGYSGLTKAQRIKRAAKILLSAYRTDNYADPEGFIAQLGVVFERYGADVADAVTDPRNSSALQVKHKFPPSLAEVAEACEAEQQKRYRYAEEIKRPKPQLNRPYTPPPNYPGCRANVLVHPDAPQYGMVKALIESGTLDERDYLIDPKGLRIALYVLETQLGRAGMRHAGAQS